MFSTCETVDDLQIQRIYMVHSGYRRGHKAKHETMEIIRRWYDGNGNRAIEARHRSMNYYVDTRWRN